MPLILLIIGVVMIIYNYRAIRIENKSQLHEDSLNISFQSVLQDSKEDLNDYKMELGLLRRDIAESLTELQEEIYDIKNNLNRLKDKGIIYENKESLEIKDFLNENEIHINTDNQHNKLEDEKEVNKDVENINEQIDNCIVAVESDSNEGIISEINFSKKADSNKTQSIKKLLDDGLTEEQICHELSVSKGEVLLVKGLFKK